VDAEARERAGTGVRAREGGKSGGHAGAAAEPPAVRSTGRFIPLTRQAVIADLCNDPAAEDRRDAFALLAYRLQRHRGNVYRALAEQMRRAYLPFSPDRDTERVVSFSQDEKDAMEESLSTHAHHLLERANYSAMSMDDINRIVNEETPYSLRISVDLAEYDRLQLYSREIYVKRHSVRRPETLYLLKAHHEVRVHRRLFVLLKLKSDEERAAEVAAGRGVSERKAARIVRRRRSQLPPGVSADFIYIKVFKDMPEHDLQILFPLRTVAFRPFDKLKFFATAGGGTLFGLFTTTGKVLAATNPMAMAGALFGFIGLLTRQVTSFFNQRTRYMMELAQKLFFHNLANNRAALSLLLDRAEEEDVKEDLMTLHFNAGETVPLAELPGRKRRIDTAVAERYGVAIDFDLDDAVARLEADGAVTRTREAVRFASIEEASALYRRLLDADAAEEARHICDPAPRAGAMEA